MQKWGVSRYSARRGLVALERAGLVAVDRHTGRKAVVTILPVATAQVSGARETST
jgi:DNA-binding FadR family transcriptional regulator